MSVQEYLDKHMLSRRIEDAVNAAVRAKAPDPVLFIVRSLFAFGSKCSYFLKVPRRFVSYFSLGVFLVEAHEQNGSFCYYKD